MHKRNPLAVGEIYHVFNKSIAGFKIFNTEADYLRIIATIRYYQVVGCSLSFSDFLRLKRTEGNNIDECLKDYLKDKKEKIADMLAYCIMPTHIHLILKQLKEKGISLFMSNILNSYSRYFNTKHKRKGPLWEGRFKHVLVETDEQLLHLTRYIHLNPATAYLVDNPQGWAASSYKEYILERKTDNQICNYENLLKIVPSYYKKFVEDMTSYQRDLAKIKNQILE